jgi:putative selenate reductase molybdopterin-binding subunit
MDIALKINNKSYELNIQPGETLLEVLRKIGILSVKDGGCNNGECGACSILLDGNLQNSCTLLAVQAIGHSIETVESIGDNPNQGWKKTKGLHLIQNAFVESGAIQCGYCTPAMVLAIKALLEKNQNPTETEIRNSLSGILCRCTGYVKPIQAGLRAAAYLRGEEVIPIDVKDIKNDQDYIFDPGNQYLNPSHSNISTQLIPLIKVEQKPERSTSKIGKPSKKVDAQKLVQGKPSFVADFAGKDTLIAKVLFSPVAHAFIKHIDVEAAKNLPGVEAVLTYKDLPRVIFSTAGQSDPIPGPLDTFSLDKKVRFVGDRVAMVAAETEEIANQAIKLIKVEYDELPPVIDPRDAMKTDTVIIHDESEFINFADSDAKINLAAKIRIDIGDTEKGFSEADFIFEDDYEVPKVQQAHIEPHVTLTYWDPDDRLIIKTSTQVPFHVRRILAPVLGLPVKKIRVIKPRIGGGFGGKQEVLIEDVAAHLTIATGKPVLYEYNRDEEFISSRSRHPMRIHMKTGVKKDGTITANEMYALSDTGAYGCHALTVTGNTGHKAMALYVGDGKYRKNPNIRFYADIVYTNTPPSGAYRGYGVPQGYWAVERHMEKIARSLNLDPIEFRLKNALRTGELHPFSTAWSEGREPKPEIIHTIGLEQCVSQGKAAIGWDQKFGNQNWHVVKEKPYLRRGVGLALVMQGTAIPYLDMGGASLKMNDDGSFNLLVGATDLGTGSDTVLAQMAAEILGVEVDDVIVYSSDTDFTPFDVGAYASSTTYISGGAVIRAADQVAERIKSRAANLIANKFGEQSIDPNEIDLNNGKAISPDGNFVTLSEIAHDSLHHENQEQIMAVGSFMSTSSPPPFAAQFAEVVVDIETGEVRVEKLVMAVDAGVIVNPITASGQVEGGMVQALGYAVCEEMVYDEKGNAREKDFIDYHIFRADEIPEIETIFIQTYEPTHPFGLKAVAEIPMDGVAPAVGNAIFDACGAEVMKNPATPERIWSALNLKKNS